MFPHRLVEINRLRSFTARETQSLFTHKDIYLGKASQLTHTFLIYWASCHLFKRKRMIVSVVVNDPLFADLKKNVLNKI